MFTYDPPGNLDDLAGRTTRAGFLKDWSDWIAKQIRDEVKNLSKPEGPDNVPSPLFFCEADSPSQSSGLPVTWNGFPLAIARKYAAHPEEGWKLLDTLASITDYTPEGAPEVTTQFRRHDEYCEWHYYADGPRGPRMVFTAEGPEYWIKLAEHDLAQVLELYRKLVSPDVQEADLLLEQDLQYTGDWVLRAGTYNPFNIWNTEKGLIHLTHYANTLGAEINLAARATVLRRDAAGNRITDSRKLIASSGYGSVNRSSDPNIGFGINITAAPVGAEEPLSITLANPVGLYINDIMETQITDGQDRPLVGWFRFIRGAKGSGLMAILEPPEGDERTLADVHIEGELLKSGAQVARLIQMVVYATTADLNAPMSPLRPPVLRACIPDGVDTSDLSKINLVGGAAAASSCAIYGQGLEPQLALSEAYPELFSIEEEPMTASTYGRGRTRNG